MKILVINCGSSSLKYQLLDMTDESVLCKGSIERIGLKINGGEENVIVKVGDEKFVYDKELKDHVAAFNEVKYILSEGEHKVIDSFDEIDAISLDRINSNDLREMGRVTSTLLKEFDNLNEKILLIATTNLYKQFDKALLRRFDYIVDFNRYSKEDLEEIADTIITSELKKYSNVKPEYKILNKIYSLVETLPYPGDLKNIIRSSIAFSDMTMEYGYLSKIYETITNEKLTNDLKKLQEQGFSVREIEKLTGISKSSVSRGINNE